MRAEHVFELQVDIRELELSGYRRNATVAVADAGIANHHFALHENPVRRPGVFTFLIRIDDESCDREPIARQSNDVQVGCLDTEHREARRKRQRAQPGYGALDTRQRQTWMSLAAGNPDSGQREVRIETAPRGFDATDRHRCFQRTRGHLFDTRPKFIHARHRDVTHSEQQHAAEKEQRHQGPRERNPCDTQSTARLNAGARDARTFSAFSGV